MLLLLFIKWAKYLSTFSHFRNYSFLKKMFQGNTLMGKAVKYVERKSTLFSAH